MSERRTERLLLAGLLVLAASHLIVFAAFDHRPRNDHDAWFTVGVDEEAHRFRVGGFGEKVATLWGRAMSRHSGHPQGAQTWLVALTGTVGLDRATLRLANMPFLLLMVAGMALAGRQLGSARLALLAAFVAACLPLVVHMSRKWFIHFHGAALVPIALAFALAALRNGPATRRLVWVGLGVALGARAWMHPIAMPDAALTFVLLGGLLLLAGRRRGEPLGPVLVGLGLTAACALAVALPQLLWSESTGGHDGSEYRAHASTWLNRRRFDEQGLPGLARDFGSLAKLVATHHWMAGVTWLLMVPGLLVAPFVARSERGRQMLFLGLLALPQVGAAAFLHGTGAFAADWLHVHLELILLALVALDAALPDRARPIWIGALLLQGLFVVSAPLIVSFDGPDPLARPEAYDGLMAPFATSDHGSTWETHHLLVREPQLGERFASELIARRGPVEQAQRQPIAVGVADLTWAAPLGCGGGEGEWRFGDRTELHVPTFDLRAVGLGPRIVPLTDPLDAGLVRLWFEHVAPDGPCELDEEVRAALVREAATRTSERLPGATVLTLSDVAQRALDATEPLSNPRPGYANVVFLIVYGAPL